MATIPPADMDLLRAELAKPAYAGMSVGMASNAFHGPGPPVPNPTPAPRVPAPPSYADLKAALTPATRAKLPAAHALLPGLLAALAGGDAAALGRHLDVLADLAALTPAELAAIQALAARTQPDPAWPATVPGRSAKQRIFGGRTWKLPDGSLADFVTDADIASAMPGGGG